MFPFLKKYAVWSQTRKPAIYCCSSIGWVNVCPVCSGALNLSVVILLHKHTNDLLDIRRFLQGHTRYVVESELEVWCSWPQSWLSCCPWTDSHFRLPVCFLGPLEQGLVNSWTLSLSLLLPSPFIPFLSSCYLYQSVKILECAHSTMLKSYLPPKDGKGLSVSLYPFNCVAISCT